MADSIAADVRSLVVAALPSAVAPEAVTDDAVIDERQLGLDSVAMVDLLCACEDRFAIELPAEILLEHDTGITVAQLVAHVRARVGDRG